MSDLIKISGAIAKGLSIVCGTCSKYWKGREQGLPDPRCTATGGCGSPLSGDDFHEYEGPITDFSRWCFMCGQPATKGVRVGSRPRVIGMCEHHLPQITQLEPVMLPDVLNRLTHKPHVVLDGTLIAPEQLFPRKKTLLDAILETEAELDVLR